jgi:hypothetical protein
MNFTRPFIRNFQVLLFSLLLIRVDAAPSTVRKWDPVDFEFRAGRVVNEPFRVNFSARVTGPKGASYLVPGFYDGGDRWKIRVSANLEGNWFLKTESSLPELNGMSTNFTALPATNGRVHGALKVDRDHPHHFMFEDGTRFFLQGYECDWLWA